MLTPSVGRISNNSVTQISQISQNILHEEWVQLLPFFLKLLNLAFVIIYNTKELRVFVVSILSRIQVVIRIGYYMVFSPWLSNGRMFF